MPYTKPLTPQSFARMSRLLKGYDFDGPALAKVLGCSAPTALSKIRDPGRLTLKDLDAIRRHGHVPLEEIKDALV